METCFSYLVLAVLVVAGLFWLLVIRPINHRVQRDMEVMSARMAAERERIGTHIDLAPLSAEGGDVSVVGESNYDGALDALSEADYKGARKRYHTAWLMAEPRNTYDKNAVQVLIDHEVVGYLSRARALKYQPLVLRAEAAGYRITCPAEIAGGWINDDGEQMDFGVTLSLATPKALEKLLDEKLTS